MQAIKTILIANRGEIAVRIIATAHRLNIRTIAIYTEPDAASLHVFLASEAVLLSNASPVSAYTDGEAIVRIAKEKGAQAVIPGYGFLSENAGFARLVEKEGLIWVGPGPEAIEAFGIKHVARELAKEAGVPIVPGTQGLVATVEEAVAESEKLGYPVMLKATAGGGGMGLVVCNSSADVQKGFETVQSRGQTLFKNAGMFIEKYFPVSHHIEVQVFGNGLGDVVHFGERECSIQRRNQKVIEECPSPFVEKHPGLRERLTSAAVSLAKTQKYASVGTIECLVDDKTGDFFFLEVNTRLQVEHGITELCYGVDLVELMLRQADAQLIGTGGLSVQEMQQLQSKALQGHAIEARVYAESPLRDFAPSPGLLQSVEWASLHGSRVDTWAFTGSRLSSHYDPLIAKIMFHAPSRSDAIDGILKLLEGSTISGPVTNKEFLAEVIKHPDFQSGRTVTSFLKTFTFRPSAVEVISAGAYTLVQDLSGRPKVGKGIPHSGAMDPVGLSIANMLVGNPRGREGLEITLSGPELRFWGPAVVALTGAPLEAQLDGSEFPMWTRKHIQAGQVLKIGKSTGGGCRSYLAVYGGFPSVADYFGSKATSALVAMGGYQGRQLAPGDVLGVVTDIPARLAEHASIPNDLRPVYEEDWELMTMPGPHAEGFLAPEDIEMLYGGEKWKVSHNASRSGVRLISPRPPVWARADGGEGGSHPSNVVEYGYPLGANNWTGDEAIIFPVDAPNFGGFVSSNVIIRAEWWKLGQIKAGNTMRYKRVSLEEALYLRQQVEDYLTGIENGLASGKFDGVKPLMTRFEPSGNFGKAVIWQRDPEGNNPLVRYRQGGDDFLLVEYGDEQFDINHRCRVTALENAVRGPDTPSWLSDHLLNTVGCCTSLQLFYDGSKLDRGRLVSYLQKLENQLGDLSKIKVPCRKFRLPLSFESKEQDDATQRYMETLRPQAPYLPDNLDFVAKNNAFTAEQLKQNMLNGELITVVVGFFCGNTVSLPVDPRQRMSSPKANPSRVFTPEGTFGWGGSCASIYPVDSPGGYQLIGRTVPCFDYLGYKKGFSIDKPWMFQDFDILTFYRVTEDELNAELSRYRAGKYEFTYEEIQFDMAEHNKLLERTKDEVTVIRAKQREAQNLMIQAEKDSLAKWRADKARNKPDESIVDALLADPAIESFDAPVDANVWKISIKEGQVVSPNDVAVVLEAMKLEIAVNAPVSGKVEKILVEQGETVQAGGKIALIRKDT